MTEIAAVADRFASGELVLVGDEHDETIFVAAAGISGGWSLKDRALTMRVAADPASGPADLAVPGHVHPARIGESQSGAAAAAVELARISERSSAVALCAVLDRDGTAVSMGAAQQDPQLGRLPAVTSGELHSQAISRAAETQAIGCQLPTRDGLFRTLAYGPAEHDPATVALIHGDPAGWSTHSYTYTSPACSVMPSDLCSAGAQASSKPPPQP